VALLEIQHAQNYFPAFHTITDEYQWFLFSIIFVEGGNGKAEYIVGGHGVLGKVIGIDFEDRVLYLEITQPT
jgi:hypothetical protein